MKMTPQTTLAEMFVELQRLGVRRFSISFPITGPAAELFPSSAPLRRVQFLAQHCHGQTGTSVGAAADPVSALNDLVEEVEREIALGIGSAP
jgi:hypothetical protein